MLFHQLDMITDILFVFIANIPLTFKIVMFYFTVYSTLVVIYQVYTKKKIQQYVKISDENEEELCDGEISTKFHMENRVHVRFVKAYKTHQDRWKEISWRLLGINFFLNADNIEENSDIKSVFLFYENVP